MASEWPDLDDLDPSGGQDALGGDEGGLRLVTDGDEAAAAAMEASQAWHVPPGSGIGASVADSFATAMGASMMSAAGDGDEWGRQSFMVDNAGGPAAAAFAAASTDAAAVAASSYWGSGSQMRLSTVLAPPDAQRAEDDLFAREGDADAEWDGQTAAVGVATGGVLASNQAARGGAALASHGREGSSRRPQVQMQLGFEHEAAPAAEAATPAREAGERESTQPPGAEAAGDAVGVRSSQSDSTPSRPEADASAAGPGHSRWQLRAAEAGAEAEVAPEEEAEEEEEGAAKGFGLPAVVLETHFRPAGRPSHRSGATTRSGTGASHHKNDYCLAAPLEPSSWLRLRPMLRLNEELQAGSAPETLVVTTGGIFPQAVASFRLSVHVSELDASLFLGADALPGARMADASIRVVVEGAEARSESLAVGEAVSGIRRVAAAVLGIRVEDCIASSPVRQLLGQQGTRGAGQGLPVLQLRADVYPDALLELGSAPEAPESAGAGVKRTEAGQVGPVCVRLGASVQPLRLVVGPQTVAFLASAQSILALLPLERVDLTLPAVLHPAPGVQPSSAAADAMSPDEAASLVLRSWSSDIVRRQVASCVAGLSTSFLPIRRIADAGAEAARAFGGGRASSHAGPRPNVGFVLLPASGGGRATARRSGLPVHQPPSVADRARTAAVAAGQTGAGVVRSAGVLARALAVEVLRAATGAVRAADRIVDAVQTTAPGHDHAGDSVPAGEHAAGAERQVVVAMEAPPRHRGGAGRAVPVAVIQPVRGASRALVDLLRSARRSVSAWGPGASGLEAARQAEREALFKAPRQLQPVEE
ncbi:hypothetical protein FNF27_05649 [Cafeteria roenbergensis]|uniref:Autophagy-related protein 2 n=1 Tax=Cafeteria roenbergensis TaxID=33653 RepID=A0A5A8E701_CAFRO|nr:hypothetical protein FNF27_05649 [Cafeteria roenbergensis]